MEILLFYTFLALLSSECQGENSSSTLHLALKRSLPKRSLENCVDAPICDAVPNVCVDDDDVLVKLLCPAKCGHCACEDDPSVNCTEILSDVCTTEYGFSICAKSCNLCDKHPEQHCADQVYGVSCDQIPYPCDDVLGKIACPHFCNLCPGQAQSTTLPTLATNLSLSSSPSTTTMQTVKTSTSTESTSTYFSTASSTSSTLLRTTQSQSSPCALNACVNGAACRVEGLSFRCICTSGFKGSFCNIPILTTILTSTSSKPNACAVNNPCFNGGTCHVDANNNPVCDCLDNYQPPYCVASVVTTTPAPTCSGEGITKNTIGCTPAEVVFMIEYSQRDTGNSVDHEINFIKDLIDEWRVDESHIRIGVVVYHDQVEEVIHINEYNNDITSLKNRIDEIGRTLQPSGTVNLASALDYVRGKSFKEARPHVPKVVIPIIHDMERQGEESIVKAASRLKVDCTFILAISAFSTSLNYDVIRRTVSSPWQDFYQAYQNYGALETAARYLNNQNCPDNKSRSALTKLATRLTTGTPTTTTLAKAKTVLNTLGQAGCSPMEVVFLIENTHGDSITDVQDEVNFVRNMVMQWSVDDQRVRVGVVVYGSHAIDAINLQDYNGNRTSLINRLESLESEIGTAGNAHVSKALHHVRGHSFQNARPGVDKVAVFIVHDMSSFSRRNFVNSVQKLKLDGLTIYGIGVSLTSEDRLIMQQNVDHFFEFSSFSRLGLIVPSQMEVKCNKRLKNIPRVQTQVDP